MLVKKFSTSVKIVYNVSMTALIETLSEMGLTDEEAKVYLAALSV